MSRPILIVMQNANQDFSQNSHRHFQRTVWNYYHNHKRQGLPWRKTSSPYRIVVSELMLQQTQVVRVIPKYQAFIKRFPNTKQLAAASQADVIRYWQGLGYNRRAKYLHQCARIVSIQYNGHWPKTLSNLKQLPGIGPYTAAAVMAFSYNQPEVCLETNIRTAIIYHYFKEDFNVSENDLQMIVKQTMDLDNPREWYWALMDYGAYIKPTYGNLNRQARSYTRQSQFKGSDRQIRGEIIRLLSKETFVTCEQVCKLGFTKKRVREQCINLCREGLIEEVTSDSFRLIT